MYLPPFLKDIEFSWRKRLNGSPEPAISRYIQPHILHSVELVSTSQVQDAPVSDIRTGENSSVTTTAGALGTSVACLWVMLQVDKDATDGVYVGNSADGQHWYLAAGSNLVLPVSDVADVIIKSASGTQTVNWLAGVA